MKIFGKCSPVLVSGHGFCIGARGAFWASRRRDAWRRAALLRCPWSAPRGLLGRTACCRAIPFVLRVVKIFGKCSRALVSGHGFCVGARVRNPLPCARARGPGHGSARLRGRARFCGRVVKIFGKCSRALISGHGFCIGARVRNALPRARAGGPGHGIASCVGAHAEAGRAVKIFGKCSPALVSGHGFCVGAGLVV